MSEFQYYEFSAIDKPLSKEDRETVSGWSSRTEASSSGAIFTYHYSGFPKDEVQVVSKYFDAMFYAANWGQYRLILKLPQALFKISPVRQYKADGLSICAAGEKHILIDFSPYDDGQEIEDWTEPEGKLSSLIQLRNDLILGDYRCLFLMWLKCVHVFYGEKWSELKEKPSVPSGLQSLNAPLQELITIFQIDEAMVSEAAKESQNPKVTKVDYQERIKNLSEQEKDEWLLKLVNQELFLPEQLKLRLSEAGS